MPPHIRWSGKPVTYNLDDPADRKSVYRQVLAEGLNDDVRWFIKVDELVAMWDSILLPVAVRKAWGRFLRQRNLLT